MEKNLAGGDQSTDLDRAQELRRYWLGHAFDSAGIDPRHWNPERGAEANRGTIERVYDYYGGLYLRHSRLQWAGMAKLIGPSFFGGFLDIGLIPDAERRLIAAVRRIVASARRIIASLVRRERALVGQEGLGFYEVTFLTMQRKIFEDQALMHEAYVNEGLTAIKALGAAGVIDTATVQAWEQIDSGEPDLVAQGNRMLLYREQHDIIDRFYLAMEAYDPPQGEAFTYLATLAGAPAIPGAKGYPAVFPLTVMFPIAGSVAEIRTPLAHGNIANFANRWQLIERDTLPAYDHLINCDPAVVRSLAATPIEELVGRFRISRRLGRILLSLVTQWKVTLERRHPTPGRLAIARTSPAKAGPLPVEIDLRHPPTRATAGLSAESDNRIWTRPRSATFSVTVLLPQGRSLATDVSSAVLMSTTPGGDPSDLSLKLPPMDIEGAQSALVALAREWGADEHLVNDWAIRATGVTLDQHAYATHVFRAQPVDFVGLEFQAEHHVAENEYVVDILMSWESSAARATTTPTGD
jgi:hypothetical protein